MSEMESKPEKYPIFHNINFSCPCDNCSITLCD
jgi:hypothetical protein